jgi:hypothetical protein
MGFKPYTPNQIGLITAISQELIHQNPNGQVDPHLYNKIIEAANIVCEACKRERVYANKPMTPSEWLECDDVGESSKYMLTVLANLGFPPENGPTPRDSNDLGRCIRMLECCGLTDQVVKMSDMGVKWSRLAGGWEQLTKWYQDNECEAIYEFLSQSA